MSRPDPIESRESFAVNYARAAAIASLCLSVINAFCVEILKLPPSNGLKFTSIIIIAASMALNIMDYSSAKESNASPKLKSYLPSVLISALSGLTLLL